MGLRTRKFVYISDRGQEFEINEMGSSHLLNAINHHGKQVVVVKEAIEYARDPDDRFRLEQDQVRNLMDRQEGLEETIHELLTELANRSPEDDAKREVDRSDNRW